MRHPVGYFNAIIIKDYQYFFSCYTDAYYFNLVAEDLDWNILFSSEIFLSK